MNSLSLIDRIGAWYETSAIRSLLRKLEEALFTVDLGNYDHISVTSASGATVRTIILGIAAGLLIAAGFSIRTRRKYGGFLSALKRAGATDAAGAKTLHELGYFRDPAIRKELTRGVLLWKYVALARDDAPAAGEFMPSADADMQGGASVGAPVDAPLDAPLGAEDPAIKSGIPAGEAGAELSAADAGSDAKIGEKRMTYAQFAEKYGLRAGEKPDFRVARFYLPEERRIAAEVRFDPAGFGWGKWALLAVLTVAAAAALCWLVPDLFRLADNLLGMF